MTAAAAPPPAILAEIEKKGFEVTHVYGLTEVYGPAVVCEWKEEWNSLKTEPKSKKKGQEKMKEVNKITKQLNKEESVPRMQKGAMAYDGPNKERSEAADRVIEKTKKKQGRCQMCYNYA